MNRTTLGSIMALAAGGMLGYGAATGRLNWTARPRRAAGQGRGHTIRDFAARRRGVGDRRRQDVGNGGAERHFQTPPLKVGGTYTYIVKATYQGKTVTREIRLTSGGINSLDLRADLTGAARLGRRSPPSQRRGAAT